MPDPNMPESSMPDPSTPSQEFRVLCLGGGATNLTLMAGALRELHRAWSDDKNKKPNIVTMAGAGAVVGLHYLAPKGMKSKVHVEAQAEALENTRNFGVSDSLYAMCPINYKVFTKSGPSADFFNDHWFGLPEVQAAMRQSGMSDAEALMSDTLLFQGAMMCPTDVDFFSLGVCGHPRFFEGLIDFERLPDPNETELEINAFCIEDQKIVDFTNYKVKDGNPEKENGKLIPQEITVDHLRAALSFPFLHPPYRIGDKHYYEGAAFQCLNDYKVQEAKDIKWAIVLDPLRRNMIGMPRNLWDAYALSILMPTAGLTECGGQLIEAEQSEVSERIAKALSNLLLDLPKDSRLSTLAMLLLLKEKIYFSEFNIPKDKVPEAWGWSRSSMKGLFDIGVEAGKDIVKKVPL